MLKDKKTEVLVIGAGPASTVAATQLSQKGYQVTIVEKAIFPRFSIGESLLPHCLDELEKVGMLEAVREYEFQYKNGAAFKYRDRYESFNFGENYTEGRNYAYQVQRAEFDEILAKEAEKAGVEILYDHEITAVDLRSTASPEVYCHHPDGYTYAIQARFVLDGSGSAKVLPKLLDLEIPSELPYRSSIFTHVIDRFQDKNYDREKILVTIHPQQRDIWYWLIPFYNGTASIGVVGGETFIENIPGTPMEKLQTIVKEDPGLSELLSHAIYGNCPVGRIDTYSSNVKSLYGKNYALLGNAGEFLDPVFSSGVTIALKSAGLAATAVDKQLKGENVNWEEEFSKPLMQGIDTFRYFVNAWYDGTLQNIIFSDTKAPQIKAMVCSVLAGYAWDMNNPCVENPQKHLKALSEACQDIG